MSFGRNRLLSASNPASPVQKANQAKEIQQYKIKL